MNNGTWFELEDGSGYKCNNYIYRYMEDRKPEIENVFFTSYNAERGQTDSTPCVAGGTGINVCKYAKEGKRVIALSQEFLEWSMYSGDGNAPIFKKDEVVWLESTSLPDDPRCNGYFIVGDAMNPRFVGGDRARNMEKRGDIFMLNRSDNVSCYSNVYRI